MNPEAVRMEPANDHEVEQYRVLVENAKEYLYGPGTDAVVDRLEQAQDLPMEMAKITVELVEDQLVMAEGMEKKISDGILPEVGRDIVNELSNIAVMSKIWNPKDEQETQKVQSKALVYAAEILAKGMAESGHGDPQQMEQMMSQIMGIDPGAQQPTMQPAPPAPGPAGFSSPGGASGGQPGGPLGGLLSQYKMR